MSDSVGKISLDLEIQSDIEGQVRQVAGAIGGQLQKTLSGSMKSAMASVKNTMSQGMKSAGNSAKSTMSGVANGIKSTIGKAMQAVKNIKLPRVKVDAPERSVPQPSDTVKAPSAPRAPPNMSMDQMVAQSQNWEAELENINRQIGMNQQKLAEFQRRYDQAVNPEAKNKIYEDLLKTEAKIVQLTGKSDRLGFSLSALDEKMAGVGNAANTSGNKTGILSRMMGDLKQKFEQTNAAATRTPSVMQRVKGMFTSSGNEARKAKSGFDASGSSLKIMARSMVTWGMIFPMVIGGIKAMANGLFTSLQTNAKFANSLNQIRTNLMVAFMPIYQAILPAINALMSAVATATQYIASFLNALFGKSFKQSLGATKNLVAAKDAMGAYGGSAKKAGNDVKKAADKVKKANRSIMGFDELNTLNPKDDDKNQDSGSGGGSGSGAPTLVDPPNMGAVDAAVMPWVKKFKDLMSKIFKPFQEAWAKEGQNTITAMKFALDGIWNLIKSIGSSFLEVWTNGTGTKILTNILLIIQDILKFIGNVANTFATAWNKGSIGTQIVQSIANAFNNVLIFLHRVGSALNEVWGKVGPSVADTFMGVLKSISGVLENLSKKLIWVWDNGGEHLFTGFVTLGAKILELAGFVFNNFIAPFANGLINILAPALAKVMDAVGGVYDKITTVINWLMGNGKPVLDAIVTVIGSIVLAIGAVKAALGVFSIIQKVVSLAGTAFSLIVSPAGLAVAIIAAVIAVGIALYRNWDKIKATALVVWNTIKNAIGAAISAISGFFVGLWEGIQTIFSTIGKWFLDRFTEAVSGIKTAFSVVAAFFKGVWTGITNAFSNVVTWFSSKFSQAVSKIKSAFSGVKGFFQGIWSGIKGAFGDIAGWFREKFSAAWTAVKNVFSKGGKVFTGIKDGILNGLKSVVNALIRGINRVISIPFSGINSALRSIRSVSILGKKPFGWLPTIDTPQIPYLAKGGVVDQPTLAMMGEAGKEAVVPLEKNTGWINQVAGELAGHFGDGGGSLTRRDLEDVIAREVDRLVNALASMGFYIDSEQIAKANVKGQRKLDRRKNPTIRFT
nr:MAG TPA: minor tail protein [Bacteriophage sp.]